jgi:hypothetical protein
MKFPFKILKKKHGYDFYIEAHGFNFKDTSEEIIDGLMDIEIEYIESLGFAMGGSPFSFFVEDMKKEEQAEHLRNIIQYYFESHKLEVHTEYDCKYEYY